MSRGQHGQIAVLIAISEWPVARCIEPPGGWIQEGLLSRSAQRNDTASDGHDQSKLVGHGGYRERDRCQISGQSKAVAEARSTKANRGCPESEAVRPGWHER